MSLLGNTDKSRRVSADVRFSTGSFYPGNKASVTLAGTFRPNFRLSGELKYNRNDVTRAGASFTTNLLGVRVNYAFRTRLFLNTFIQYNSDTDQVSSNVRLNFIHRPLSDLFVVYNEQRPIPGDGPVDRRLTLKYTQLIDF